MKALSKEAELIFRVAMARCGTGSGASCKIDQAPGRYIALCVEQIGSVDYCGTVFPLWSFAHYGEQNGDAMRDPDVVMMDAGLQGLFPVSWQNDYVGMDDDCLVYDDSGRATGYRVKTQADLAAFCGMWAGNLREQQGLC
jgi:hypothetical protein